ncbi:MAG: hypothetical protein FOGNACKC_00311 [Anaerolineae bacterium]|nr:hypothetical protein [Anaerolineae bacterium]
MSTKEEYLHDVEARLKSWDAAVDGLAGVVGQAQTEARNRFRQRVQNFSSSEASAIQHLVAMKQTDDPDWEEHQKQLIRVMATLQEKFNRLKAAAKAAANDSLGWAEGMAKAEHVESIGWAEGMAEKDNIESIGWAEGVAAEDLIESSGWTEGFDQKS